jgi:hypothetical protein
VRILLIPNALLDRTYLTVMVYYDGEGHLWFHTHGHLSPCGLQSSNWVNQGVGGDIEGADSLVLTAILGRLGLSFLLLDVSLCFGLV